MAINEYLQGIDRATSGQKQDVSNAAKDLATLQAGAGSLPAKLKEALNTKLNNNKDIINQQSETMQNYFNSGAQAREKYQDVWNPFKKASLVQQERSMALRPYDTLSGVLENRMGSVNDVVQSGIQGWQGLVNSAQTKAELAKSNLETALQSYLQATNMQQGADDLAQRQAVAAEQARQFGITSGMNQQQIDNQSDQFAKNLALEKLKAGLKGSDANSDGYITVDGKRVVDPNIAAAAQSILNSQGTIALSDFPSNLRTAIANQINIAKNTPVKTEVTTGNKGSNIFSIIGNMFKPIETPKTYGNSITKYIPDGVDMFGNPITKKVTTPVYSDPFAPYVFK